MPVGFEIFLAEFFVDTDSDVKVSSSPRKLLSDGGSLVYRHRRTHFIVAHCTSEGIVSRRDEQLPDSQLLLIRNGTNGLRYPRHTGAAGFTAVSKIVSVFCLAIFLILEYEFIVDSLGYSDRQGRLDCFGCVFGACHYQGHRRSICNGGQNTTNWGKMNPSFSWENFGNFNLFKPP